ncbi:MAG: hypothetical protein Kow0059_13500 [Candidatus Sumerlaeia bacterium]
MKHRFLFLTGAVLAAALGGCASVKGNFREGNPLRNPPVEAGIFVTPFDVKTPYSIIGVVEVRAFPAIWAPPLSEQDMYEYLVNTVTSQKEKIDAIIQVSITPYNTVGRRRGLLARGLAVRYLATAPGSRSAEEYFLDGWRAIQEERFDDAIVDFLNVIRLDPSIAEAHFNLAQLYLDKEQYDRALWHIDAFLQSFPSPDQATKGQALRERIVERSRTEERVYFWNRIWSGAKTFIEFVLAPFSFLVGI